MSLVITARKAAAAIAAATMAVGSLAAGAFVAAPAASASPSTTVSAGNFKPKSDVVVIEFQQNWNSVAKECTDVLGPEGVGYVEVSPATEEITGSQWWTSYQPVSYKLDSKEGTEEEFKDMIATCNAAGVGVVADAITNHMAAAPQDGSSEGTGVAGSTYTSDGSFPAVPWTSADFHTCTSGVNDYMDVKNVQECQLDGLQDLDTGDEHVQDVLADYLAKLYTMGVSGFRMDAIKHIAPSEVLAIKQKLAKKVGVPADDIWWMQEVIGDSGNAQELTPSNYLKSGDVSEFQFTYKVKSAFGMSIADLKSIGTTDDFVDSDKAAVFVSNWDTERNGKSLSYKDGKTYILANAFMLAYGYGTPNIQSGYAFKDKNAGAPGATDTSIPDTQCGTNSPWLCVERWTQIRGMIKFHNATMGEKVTDWWDDESNNLAFGRGSKGFIAMNGLPDGVTNTYQTSMPAGTYCNLYGPGDCSETVTVADDGTFTASLDGYDTVAIDVDDTPQTWTGTAATDPSDPPLDDETGTFLSKKIDMTYGGAYSTDGEQSSDANDATGAAADSAASDETIGEAFSKNATGYIITLAIVVVFCVGLLAWPSKKGTGTGKKKTGGKASGTAAATAAKDADRADDEEGDADSDESADSDEAAGPDEAAKE